MRTRGCVIETQLQKRSWTDYQVLKRNRVRKVMPGSKYPREANDEVKPQKINLAVKKKLMFRDEAVFGRISKPKYCLVFYGHLSGSALSSHQGISLCLRHGGIVDR